MRLRRIVMTKGGLKISAVAALVALLSTGLVATAQAQGMRSGDNVGVGGDETVESTVFISGRTIDIAGTVNGDVFCAGQTVTISGTVNGDVICAGQTIRVSGTVDGDVRLAGQTLVFGGDVSGNLTVAGQTFTSENGSRIGGDASIAGQDATLNGPVGRDLFTGSATTTINGAIGRNVTANVQRLSLGDATDIGGRIDYTSANQLQRSADARVVGQVSRTEPARQDNQGLRQASWLFMLYFVLSMLVLALVTVLFIPHIYHRASLDARRHPFKTLLIGFVASIVGPVIVIGLMFTVIGIPLAILFLLIWLVLHILAGPFAAYLLGRYLLHTRNDNAIWTMLLGAAILLLIYLIPIVGWLAAALALWFGLGMLLWQLAKVPRFRYRMPDDQPVVKRSENA